MKDFLKIVGIIFVILFIVIPILTIFAEYYMDWILSLLNKF